MQDQPEDPIAALWDAWEVLWNQHGRPSPTKIARWSAKNPKVATLKEGTIRGWMKPPHTTVPDWNDGFSVLLKYIDSITPDETRTGARQQDKPYWRDLWLKADDRRKARLATARTDTRADEATDENLEQQTADLTAHEAGTQPPAPDQPPISTPTNHTTSPPPPPPATSEPDTDGSPTKPTIFTKFQKRQIKPWQIAGATGITTICVLAIIFWPIDGDDSAAGTNSAQPTNNPASAPTKSKSATPTRPATRYCAFVTKEPAAVYPKPDINTKEIKFKPLHARVEVFPDREHPPGWLVVHTPQDSPGTNWMQSTVLTEPAPCEPPLPGQR
jgi:hypothetical protein